MAREGKVGRDAIRHTANDSPTIIFISWEQILRRDSRRSRKKISIRFNPLFTSAPKFDSRPVSFYEYPNPELPKELASPDEADRSILLH